MQRVHDIVIVMSPPAMSLQNLEVCTLTFELCSLGLDLDTATNSHPGVLHPGRGINECAISQMDVQLEDPFVSFGCWWTIKIPWVYSK